VVDNLAYTVMVDTLQRRVVFVDGGGRRSRERVHCKGRGRCDVLGSLVALQEDIKRINKGLGQREPGNT
jgi:hypothetical protein